MYLDYVYFIIIILILKLKNCLSTYFCIFSVRIEKKKNGETMIGFVVFWINLYIYIYDFLNSRTYKKSMYKYEFLIS